MGYNLPLDVELSTQRSISAICSGHTASVIRHLNGGIVSHRSSECPGSPMFFEVLLRKSNGDLICCASPRRQCQIMSDLFLDAHRDFGGVHEAGWSSIQHWTGSQMGGLQGPKLPICKYVLSWGLLLEEWLGGYLCKKWSDIPNTPHLKTLENELPWKRAMW